MATRISNIFPFLLITLLCVIGVELLYLGVEHYMLAVKPVEQASVGSEQQSSTRVSGNVVGRQVDYGIILRRNLFGPPPSDKKVVPEAVNQPLAELEATSLEIVLMGTINGSEQDSRAIILNKRTRKQDMYQDGDEIENAQIKEILRGKVVLSREGKDEILDMSEASKFAPKSPARAVAPRATSRRPSTIAAPTGATTTRRRVVRPTRRIVRTQPAVEVDQQEIEEMEELVEMDELEELLEDEQVDEEQSEEPADEATPVSEN